MRGGCLVLLCKEGDEEVQKDSRIREGLLYGAACACPSVCHCGGSIEGSRQHYGKSPTLLMVVGALLISADSSMQLSLRCAAVVFCVDVVATKFKGVCGCPERFKSKLLPLLQLCTAPQQV